MKIPHWTIVARPVKIQKENSGDEPDEELTDFEDADVIYYELLKPKKNKTVRKGKLRHGNNKL